MSTHIDDCHERQQLVQLQEDKTLITYTSLRVITDEQADKVAVGAYVATLRP